MIFWSGGLSDLDLGLMIYDAVGRIFGVVFDRLARKIDAKNIVKWELQQNDFMII